MKNALITFCLFLSVYGSPLLDTIVIRDVWSGMYDGIKQKTGFRNDAKCIFDINSLWNDWNSTGVNLYTASQSIIVLKNCMQEMAETKGIIFDLTFPMLVKKFIKAIILDKLRVLDLVKGLYQEYQNSNGYGIGKRLADAFFFILFTSANDTTDYIIHIAAFYEMLGFIPGLNYTIEALHLKELTIKLFLLINLFYDKMTFWSVIYVNDLLRSIDISKVKNCTTLGCFRNSINFTNIWNSFRFKGLIPSFNINSIIDISELWTRYENMTYMEIIYKIYEIIYDTITSIDIKAIAIDGYETVYQAMNNFYMGKLNNKSFSEIWENTKEYFGDFLSNVNFGNVSFYEMWDRFADHINYKWNESNLKIVWENAIDYAAYKWNNTLKGVYNRTMHHINKIIEDNDIKGKINYGVNCTKIGLEKLGLTLLSATDYVLDRIDETDFKGIIKNGTDYVTENAKNLWEKGKKAVKEKYENTDFEQIYKDGKEYIMEKIDKVDIGGMWDAGCNYTKEAWNKMDIKEEAANALSKLKSFFF